MSNPRKQPLKALTPPDPVKLAAEARDAIKRAIDDGRIHRPRSYQGERLASTSRFNLDLWSRQSGKSDANALDSVLLGASTGYGVMPLSGSQDLTKELMLKVAQYTEVVSNVAGEIQRAVSNGELDETLYVDDEGVRITQTVIRLPNGERIVGRPANPRTARGYSMHVKLDEFGMHRDQDEIYAAAYGSITSNRKLRLDVMSTAGLSANDKFSDLCGAAIRKESDFAFRKVTIFDAIAAGLDADAEVLKRNLRDDDKWRREYLCEFVDEAGALLPLTLIRPCEHEGIKLLLPPDPSKWDASTLGWDPNAGPLHLGMDVGRRHDLTVFWLLQQVGDVRWTRAMIALLKVPFAEQMALAGAMLERLPIVRMCIDESGMGMPVAEELQRRFGTYRVEGVTFTGPVKAQLAEPLVPLFQDRLIRVPIGVEIRGDLNSIRKTTTAAGNTRYLAERTTDGHADRFWALALAVHAASAPVQAGLIVL